MKYNEVLSSKRAIPNNVQQPALHEVAYFAQVQTRYISEIGHLRYPTSAHKVKGTAVLWSVS